MSPIPISNLNEVDTWEGGEILPPGTYVCQIDEAQEGTSSGGHPQIELSLRALGSEHNGGTIRDWIVVLDTTLGKVKSLLEAASVRIPEGDFDLDPTILEGQRVQILVREEPYEQKLRSKVKGYSPPPTNGAPGVHEPLVASAGSQSRIDDDIPF